MSAADTLMEHLRFTADDLAVNRTGELSAHQRRYLTFDRQKNLIVGLVTLVVLILATAGLLFGGLRDNNWVLLTLGGILLAVNAATSWVVGIGWVRATYDLRTNTVEVVEGQAQHVVRHVAKAASGSVRVGDKVEIPAPNMEMFKAFQPGATYRLYRTSHSGRLLSVERVTVA
jgi:hypothetical protein